MRLASSSSSFETDPVTYYSNLAKESLERTERAEKERQQRQQQMQEGYIYDAALEQQQAAAAAAAAAAQGSAVSAAPASWPAVQPDSGAGGWFTPHAPLSSGVAAAASSQSGYSMSASATPAIPANPPIASQLNMWAAICQDEDDVKPQRKARAPRKFGW